MKQMSTLKKLLLASSVACVSVANAQIHPLAFGSRTLIGGGTAESNWYADYVGLRFVVSYPSSLAGPKVYSHAGTGTTPWGTTVTTPINDVPIIMPPLGGDTLAASGMTAGSMAGKIAYIYRGGGIEFVCKALNCQAGGAIAVVIVNNQNGGPIGMGAGTMCSAPSVTIPVFMISKEDGDIITSHYRSGTDTARFTITPWGLGLGNDAGFVAGALAGSHAYAIPSNQLGASANPFAYAMKDGAFIANYGTNDLTGVTVSSTTKFFPGGTGSGTTVHSGSVNLANFTVADSIYAMFDASTSGEYDLAASGPGRFDVEYNIAHSATDDFPADNTEKISFYVTDSLYSKGRYDFAKNEPIRTIGLSYGGGTNPFIWGPFYYVKTGGTALQTLKYSISMNSATVGAPLGATINFYLFKWVDGSGSQPEDSVMQDGELSLVSLGTQTLSGPTDTSGATITFRGMGNPSTGAPMTVMLDPGWYYMAVEVPVGFFLGADGVMHPLPRVYGRALSSGILDYSNMVRPSADDITSSTNPAQGNIPLPSTFSNYINTVDSFNFANTKGVIPAVAMIANNNPTIDAVYEVGNVDTRVNVFPNPAKENLQVSLQLDETSKKVTYTIIDGLGRFVSKEVHNNVKEENFNLNISKLASGNYFLVINTDTKAVARKFVVAK